MMKNKSWATVITILCLLFGLLISVQYKTQQAASSSLDTQSEEDLVAILQELNGKRISLTQQQASLQSLDALQAETDTESAAFANLENENRNLAIAAEEVGIEGESRFESDDNILSSDLIDIVNELWVSGAGRVSVNDIRVGGGTHIATAYIDGNKELVHRQRPLQSPIIIRAIGNGEDLKAGMVFPGGIIDGLKAAYNLEPAIAVEKKLRLPAEK